MTDEPRWLSASQISTYEECNRFWWLQRILRLQEPPAQHFTFGTVLHQCLERWLSADKHGRVPSPFNGRVDGKHDEGPLAGQTMLQPVDIFPENWEHAIERDGSLGKKVTPNEARLIKKLVNTAIEKGIIQRRETTQVERKVDIELIPGAMLTGYVDEFHATGPYGMPEVRDHKSFSKGSIRYLKKDGPTDAHGNITPITSSERPEAGPEKRSPNCIADDQQVLTYAVVTSKLDDYEGPVRVRHNQFPKFPKRDISTAAAVVSQERLDEHWSYLQDVAERMLRTAKVKRWEDVDGPEDSGKCSRWYGKPCPMSGVCGRTETPEAHQVRVQRLIEQDARAERPNLPLPEPRKTKAQRRKNREKNPMGSIFDRAKQQKSGGGTAKSDAKPKSKAKGKKSDAMAEAKAKAQVNSGSAPAEQPANANGAPWANPTCPACKGRGINAKGAACPICDNTAKRSKRPTSQSYILDFDDEDQAIVVARDEHIEALEEAGMPLQWIEADGASEAPAPQEDPEPAPEPAPEPEEAQTEDESPEEPAAEESVPEAPQDAVSTPVETAKPKTGRKKAASKKANTGGRPKTGLTLLLTGNILHGSKGRPTMFISQVLDRFGKELAEDMGATSYWNLDTWKRRERLAEKRDYIVGELARTIVIVPSVLGNDDIGSLVNAILSSEDGLELVVG